MLIDDVIKTAKRIHFIGIGGSGMCPLAEILHSRGHFLTGSDNNESDTLKRIRALGIPVTMGQRAENVEGADMVVFTAALLPDNPELVAAREKGIPVCNSNGENASTTAEFTIALMLACMRRLSMIDARCKKGEWHSWTWRHEQYEMRDKVISSPKVKKISEAEAELDKWL